MVAIFYACFRFKYEVFRKKIIPFEAVNRKNKLYSTVYQVGIGQFTAKKSRYLSDSNSKVSSVQWE